VTEARDAILRRLRANRPSARPLPPSYQPRYSPAPGERQARFTERMRAVQAEVIELGEEGWVNWANRELPRRKLKRVLVGDHAEGQAFAAMADPSLSVSAYSEQIDSWKSRLFHQVDVAITGTRGAIAETGSLLLWPDASEPRLMSLVPPVHIALLNRQQIYPTLAEVMAGQNWAQSMPTNALLISGPSKTADIEQTLAYGIHGPQQLIVLIIDQTSGLI